MNRDDIIRMAREAGDVETDSRGRETFSFDCYGLERFAELVAAHEREACAKACDKRAADYRMGFEEKYEAQACAYDIRARGEA
jgi:hypothetical protein